MTSTLNLLAIGDFGVIKQINDAELSNYFIEMGLIPGEKIKLIRTAPFGDPLLVEVAGFRLSIRKQEASAVEVEIKK